MLDPTQPSVIWFNGSIVSPEEVPLSPLDSVLMQGHGIFETLGAWNHVPYAIGLHYDRLASAAERLEIIPPPQEAFRAALTEAATAAPFENARLRATLMGHGTFFVTAVALYAPSESSKLHIVPYTRNQSGALSGIKSLSYGENAIALTQAQIAGANEAVFANTDGMICEGSCTNLFFVLDGQLITPPLSSGCLPGITRDLVLKLCASNGIKVAEIDNPISALENAEEIFLTSSLRGIQPASQINSTPLHSPGIVTKKLQALYNTSKAENPDPD